MLIHWLMVRDGLIAVKDGQSWLAWRIVFFSDVPFVGNIHIPTRIMKQHRARRSTGNRLESTIHKIPCCLVRT